MTENITGKGRTDFFIFKKMAIKYQFVEFCGDKQPPCALEIPDSTTETESTSMESTTMMLDFEENHRRDFWSVPGVFCLTLIVLAVTAGTCYLCYQKFGHVCRHFLHLNEVPVAQVIEALTKPTDDLPSVTPRDTDSYV